MQAPSVFFVLAAAINLSFDRSQHFKILVTENLGLSNSFLDISKAKEVAKTRWKTAKDD